MAILEEDRNSRSKGRKKRKQRKTRGQGITARASRCAINVQSASGLCALLAGGVCAVLKKRGPNSTVSRQCVSSLTEVRCSMSWSSGRRCGREGDRAAGRIMAG